MTTTTPKYLSASATDEEVTAAAAEYITFDTNEECRAAIRAMMQASDVAGLRKALTSHLEFGTAGLRGPMGPGSARRAQQAARYLATSRPGLDRVEVDF